MCLRHCQYVYDESSDTYLYVSKYLHITVSNSNCKGRQVPSITTSTGTRFCVDCDSDCDCDFGVHPSSILLYSTGIKIVRSFVATRCLAKYGIKQDILLNWFRLAGIESNSDSNKPDRRIPTPNQTTTTYGWRTPQIPWFSASPTRYPP